MNDANLVHPLDAGGLKLENNVLQAPLAGYSSAPFRRLTWELGRPGLLATEMISASALFHGAPHQERYLAKAEGEGPVAFQIWGRDPEHCAVACRIVAERGADAVDLNCGCPVRKVRAAGAGSKLMEEPALVGKIVAAMRRSTGLPVTVKIRVGISAEDFNGPELARIVEGEGADLLTVHGRHARESYSTPARYGEIARVVRAVSRIPVVGNGDVADAASAERMFRETGCAGVMVGRACMGAPWVFREIIGGLAGVMPSPPGLERIGEVLLRHYDLLAELIGPDKAIRQTRKLGAFYSRGICGAKDFRNRINDCASRRDLEGLIASAFAKNPPISA